jgi:hypothetical protein
MVEQQATDTLQPFLEERKRHVVDLLPGVGERCGQPIGALWALAQQVEDLEVYVRLSIVGVHSTIMPVWGLREALIRREARGKDQKSPSERHLGTPPL